jgi:hypothetical protein
MTRGRVGSPRPPVHNCGRQECANGPTVAMDHANAAFLTTLREDVLSARVVRRTIARAIELAIEEAEAEVPAAAGPARGGAAARRAGDCAIHGRDR